MDQSTFCFLVVNYNGRSDTIECVNSIFKAAAFAFATIKIIVIDNSNDQFDFNDERVCVIRTGYNIGLSGAWYLGFYNDFAQSNDYTILINNDARVAKNFLSELQKGIINWGDTCAFGPRIYDDKDTDTIWSRGGEIQKFLVKVKHHGEKRPSKEVERGDFETGHLSGCCLVIKTEHLNNIGGPDTNFFFRGEEWDLNYRLAEAGIRLIILDHVEVFHKINGSHSRFAPDMLYYAYRAKVLFAKKILPFWYFPLWYFVAFIFAAAIAPGRFAKMAKQKNSLRIRRALIKALLDGLKHNKILKIENSGQ